MSTGGGWYMLAAQSFSVVCLFFWGLIITYPIIWLVNKAIPIRLEPEDEILGCDIVEHFMGDEKERMLTPLEGLQISNIKFGDAQVSFNLPQLPYHTNASYKDFNTMPTRRNIHTNLGFDRNEAVSRQHSSDQL